MLDNHNRVAFAFQTAYDFQQQGDVGEVQAGGGFVEDVERSAGVAFGEFQGEFDALGFAAGEGGGGLAEADVAETYVHQGLQFARYGGDGVEKFAGFFDRHVEDLADVFAFVLDFEGFAVVAFAVADFAGDVHVGQEVHFDFDYAVAWQASQRPPLTLKENLPTL